MSTNTILTWPRAAVLAALWVLAGVAAAVLALVADHTLHYPIYYAVIEAVAAVLVLAAPLAGGLAHRSWKVSFLGVLYLFVILLTLWIVIRIVDLQSPDEEYFRRQRLNSAPFRTQPVFLGRSPLRNRI